jgi:hypothetical protein
MMAPPRRVTLGIVLAGVLLAGGALLFKARETSGFFAPRNLLSRFPAGDSVVVSIDVSLLRRAGLLGAAKSSKMAAEPEYKQFVDGTGFDFERDLDTVVASFSSSGTYFIARGRFNWSKLRDYAVHSGGSCYDELCRVQGSKPERHISFLPLRDDAIALAVSSNDLAATRLTKTSDPIATPLPSAPAWISIPGAALRGEDALPPGLRVTFSALQNASRVLLTFDASTKGVEADMEAECGTAENAGILLSQLQNATTLLKDAVHRDQQIQGDELAATLAAGTFERTGTKVVGKWPVEKSLIDSLTAGI